MPRSQRLLSLSVHCASPRTANRSRPLGSQRLLSLSAHCAEHHAHHVAPREHRSQRLLSLSVHCAARKRLGRRRGGAGSQRLLSLSVHCACCLYNTAPMPISRQGCEHPNFREHLRPFSQHGRAVFPADYGASLHLASDPQGKPRYMRARTEVHGAVERLCLKELGAWWPWARLRHALATLPPFMSVMPTPYS